MNQGSNDGYRKLRTKTLDLNHLTQSRLISPNLLSRKQSLSQKAVCQLLNSAREKQPVNLQMNQGSYNGHKELRTTTKSRTITQAVWINLILFTLISKETINNYERTSSAEWSATNYYFALLKESSNLERTSSAVKDNQPRKLRRPHRTKEAKNLKTTVSKVTSELY